MNIMRASYPAPDVYFQRKVALISGASRSTLARSAETRPLRTLALTRLCSHVPGITGQDGSYLAELLLSKGYKVHG